MLLEKLLKLSPDDALIYLEQNVNYLFQGQNRESEVSPLYQPEKEAEYQIPYVLLDLNHPEVEYFEAHPEPELVNWVKQNGRAKFFVHPDMISEYKEAGFSELLHFAGEIKVSPTASTRTVMTRNLPYNFMIKTNLTKKIGFLSRKLTKSSVVQSNQIMSELIQLEKELSLTFAYLPETIGVVFKETIGEIFRECQARPKVNEKRYVIPFFSLISKDRKEPKDPLLLCQIIEFQGYDPFETLYGEILIPLLENWSYLVLERAIIPIAHFQNLLLEINQNGKPTRIIFRDLQDAIIDREVRRQKNLHANFTRHFIDDVSHTKLIVNGKLIQDANEARQIRYSLAYDFWLGLIFHCFSVVSSKYPSCKEKKIQQAIREFFWKNIQPKAENLFPPQRFIFTTIDPANPRTRLVENRGKPIYR